MLEQLQPQRWKVFQVLRIEGQNDGRVDDLLITETQFQAFIDRHQAFNPIAETNDMMRGSYVMLDPLGRFFQNTTGKHTYSRSILKVSIKEAVKEVGWDKSKFFNRNGFYNW
ncbi:MAG: hypothetical protein ACFFB3_01210 [Candidatus Hodarchaeota archaeon]